MEITFSLVAALLAMHCSHCACSTALQHCLDGHTLFREHCGHLRCVTLEYFLWSPSERDYSTITLRMPSNPQQPMNN